MFDQAELNQRGAFGMSEMPAQIDEMPEFVQRENVQSVAHAPLRVAQNQIGVLLDFDTQPRLWTDDELQVLDLLAHQAAIGLDKARLFAETQTALNLMTRLYDLSGQMLSVTTLEETARVVTETLRDSFAAHVFSLDLLDAAGNLEFQYGVGRADTAYQNVPPRPDGLTMRVWKSGERFIANDPAELHPQARADGFQSAIVLPLRGKTRTLGVLYLQYREPHTFNEREIQRLTLFANQTATTIENVRLVQETRHRLAELEAVNRISTALRSARALDEMLPLLLDETRVILNAPAGAIYLFDPVKNELSITVARGWYTQLPRVPIQQNEGVVGHVCATGQAYISREFARDPLIRARARSQIPFGFGGIVAPIRSAHAIVGALAISVPLPREITSEQTHLLSTLAEIAGNAIQRMRLHEQTERDAVELARAYDATLAGWSRALELRDEETEGHSARVTRLTLQLARAMGLSEEDLVHIRRGVLVHDIGKMGIPDSILLKPGALDAAEWEVMRWHPVYAHEMLAPISFLRHALAIPFCHHEKWDGTGYPRGLKGEDIPLAARIFAVVDVWDALTSNRPYRSAWTRDQVREYIRAHTGTHFDPQVVEKFLQIVNAE
jgi:HD-GYP domain-containing protein (c-di-GMP phosphodiesterase class II)